jgi:hypothetical protein
VNQEELATVQCIIAHPSKPKLLAIRHKGGYLPPQIKVPKDAELGPNIAKVTAAVESKYGLHTTALRVVGRFANYHCIEVELHSKDRRNLQAVWVGEDDYVRIRGTKPGKHDPFMAWFAEQAEARTPAQRPPWERPGWFKRARHWIDFELDRLGIQATGSVRQTRALAYTGTILRVSTSLGILYFKASNERPPREVPLTRFLAERWPGRVTEVLAYDESKNWMLMRGDPQEEQLGDPSERWVRGAAALASIQAESVDHLERLRDLGCETMGIGQLRQFLQDETVPNAIPHIDRLGFSAQEREEFAALAPRLAGLCEQLADFNMPEMLIHVDFRATNFFAGVDSVRIIDWQRACIGHPFFSLLTAFTIDRDWAWDRLKDDPGIRAYLARFADFDSEERLLMAMQRVCRLFLAWRLWWLLQELPYCEPNSFSLLRAKGVVTRTARRLLAVHRN